MDFYDAHTKERLRAIHSNYTLRFGSFDEEVPEQQMAVAYLTGNETVLEIGANIGRNTLVIADILGPRAATNFVTMETDPKTVEMLTLNRDMNGLDFKIVNAALSKRPLIQKGWDTMPSAELLPGYSWVPTITYEQLLENTKLKFDTLVLDCEGAFYYILMDMPEILDTVTCILMENDYHNIEHKIAVDTILHSKGFQLIHQQGGGWGPCSDFFFQAWRRALV